MQSTDLTCNVLNIFPSAPSLHGGGHHWNGKNIIVKSPEVFYTLEGGIVMHFGGKSFAVPEGHAVFIPANTPYTCWGIQDAQLTYINFTFKAEWNDADFFSKFDIGSQNPVIEIPKNPILKIYNATMHFSPENIPQRMNICVQLMNFLTLLCAAFLQREETKRLYKDVLEFMHAHLSKGITLEDMAALRNADPGYFSKKFKETAGVSPQHFLSRLRLWRAASLLKNEDATVHQAAAAVGFSDIYYFKTYFKNFFGVPPESYKKIFVEPRYVNVKR